MEGVEDLQQCQRSILPSGLIDDDPHLPNQEERHVRGQGPNLSQK